MTSTKALFEEMVREGARAAYEWHCKRHPYLPASSLVPFDQQAHAIQDEYRARQRVGLLAALERLREPTWQMCEAGEDSVAEIKSSNVVLGVRCGCAECDKAAWEAVATIHKAMLSTLLSAAKESTSP